MKVWMDADTLVIFGAREIVRVCAGKAAITRVLTGVGTLMRVPVVTGVVFSYDVIKPITIVIVQKIDFIDVRAD